MEFVVSKTDTIIQALKDAKHLLRRLLDFDCLLPEEPEEILLSLMQVSKLFDQDHPEMSLALSATLQAISIPFSDPVMESWASITERAPWIAAELEFIEAAHDTQEKALCPSPKLLEYRSRFRAAEDGWPVREILDTTKAREGLLKERAARRKDIYDLFHDVETPDFKPHGLSSLGSPPLTWNLYQKQLQTFFTKYPDLLFRNLLHLDEEPLHDLLGHLRFGIFREVEQLPVGFLQQHEKIDALWQRQSPSFASFSALELKNTLSRSQSFLSVIFYDHTPLQYGLTLCGRDSFLPQTLEKLHQINSVILRADFDIYDWQFFSSGNPQLYYRLRHLRVDWYSLYNEMVSDLAIQLGKEHILGIVAEGNPADQGHRRIGYKTLPTQLLFKGDHGTYGRIKIYSPYGGTGAKEPSPVQEKVSQVQSKRRVAEPGLQ
jgi:hypothetical protein